MGETYVDLTIYGPRGTRTVTCLADTAATYTKIPPDVAGEVGLVFVSETPVELGDGRIVIRRIAVADVRIENVRGPTIVAVGEQDEQPLLGYTTLELLGFKVDTVAHRLERRTPIEY